MAFCGVQGEKMMERYVRQMLLSEVGQTGQVCLSKASVAVIGCGGLGTVASDLLVRAGVGRIKIIDRDKIELSNLQRQTLYNEDDIARNLPKAEAAAGKLRRVNSQTIIEPWVINVNAQDIESIVKDVDLVLDGTDNFETRYLINDACVKHDVPWIYASVAGTCGMTMTIIPHQTACLQCLCAEMPLANSTPGTDIVGIWGPVVNMTASLEVSEGLKLLMGQKSELLGSLIYMDLWNWTLEKLKINRRACGCPACI